MGVRSIHRERDGSIRLRMNKLWNGGEKVLGSGEGRVESRKPRDQERDFPGPIRESMRGARTLAAPRRNFL